MFRKKNLSFNWTDSDNILVSSEASMAEGAHTPIDSDLGFMPSLNQIRSHPWDLGGGCINKGKLTAIADKLLVSSG